MIVVGLVFSGLGLFLAALVKNSQTFQIVITAITMPLTFLCGAYIPLSMLPKALQYVAYLNPMTYTTAFKIGNFVITPPISMAIVIIFGIVFLLLSTFVFSKVDFSRINRSKSKDADIWS